MMYLAKRLKFISPENQEKSLAEITSVAKMLNALIKAIKATSTQIKKG
jgi:hypothetical protein